MLMIWPKLVSSIVNENTFSGSIPSTDASYNRGEGLCRPVFTYKLRWQELILGSMALTVGFFQPGQSIQILL